jgi:hypothetical protein
MVAMNIKPGDTPWPDADLIQKECRGENGPSRGETLNFAAARPAKIILMISS